MADQKESADRPFSGNPDLDKGILRIDKNAKLPIRELIKAREDGANVKVEDDGSVTIDVGNRTEGTS